jgi:hypothetical protein
MVVALRSVGVAAKKKGPTSNRPLHDACETRTAQSGQNQTLRRVGV